MALGQEGHRAQKRYLRQKRKGEGHIGPDGPRRVQGPHGTLRDTGKGLPASRRQRENPRPERISLGQRPNRNRPNRRPKNANRHPRNRDPFAPQVNALAQLQYGPQERELEYQRQVEAQRGVNANSWYNDLYQRSLMAAQATQAAYSQAQQMAYGQANQNFATDQAANQQLLQQQNQQAAIRGTAVDPMLNQQMQQGAQVRQTQQNQFGNLTGNLGANASGYAQARTVQATEQGIQAGQDVQARQRKVESLARELLADKGAFKVKTGMELRSQAHKERLEDKAFGLDVAQEQFDQQDALADNRRMSAAERRQRREARSRIRDRRHDNRLADSKEQRIRDQDLADDGRLNGSSGGSSGGKFTPTQVRAGRRTLRNLVGRVKNNVDPPDSVDPLLARAAVQIADNGGVTPTLAKKIKRQYGFTPKIKRMSVKQMGEGAKDKAESFF